MGVPYADRENFQVNSARFLERDIDLEGKMAAYTALTTYLAELVTRKRAEPGEDILSDLARHDDLTIEELTGAAFLLLLAGHETTANMLALGTFALLENPEQAAELRANPDLMPEAVEELLRYLSIADIFYRYATEDIELGGETIAKGSTVVVSLLAANHDPHRFDNPDSPRHPSQRARSPVLRPRCPPVPRPATGPHRDARRLRRTAAALPDPPARHPRRRGETQDRHEHLRRPRTAGHLDTNGPVKPSAERVTCLGTRRRQLTAVAMRPRSGPAHHEAGQQPARKGSHMSHPQRRGLLAAVALGTALGTALVVAGAPAATATAKSTIEISGGLTQPVFSYQDAIREYVRVQSPVDSDGDGKKDLVRVDIIRPKETSSGLKVPVIMHESPYFDTPGAGFENDHKKYDANGNPTSFPLFLDNYFVPRGYAYVSVDMAGTRLSDGCPTIGGASDVLGGKAVIDWLNGRATAYDAQGNPVKASWTTGRTGMIGHSYEGSLAIGVAGTGVRGLETIVPVAGNSSWYDLWRANGTLTDTKGGPEELATWIDLDPVEKCAAVHQQLTAGSDDATGNYNAFWNERNYRTGSISQVRNVRASVFSVMGMQDRNVMADQFSRWWAGLPRGVQRKAWVTQYGHLDPFWARRDVWINTLHKWFDHELMGVPNDILRQPRADVQLGPDRWITQADWPAPARTVTLRPQQDGSLGLKPSTGTRNYLETLQTETAMASDPGTANPYRLAFRTPALKAATRLSGAPSVSLRVTLDRPTANLGVLLVDYGQDTRIYGVDPHQGQGLKFIDGEDCVGEGTADDDGCYRRAGDNTVTSGFQVVARGFMDAQNYRSLSRPTPLKPGKPYQITWSMLPQDFEFKAGHQLGLVLTGTNDDITDAETGTGANVTVDLAGTSVSLPLVAGTSSGN